jgi:serine/threonine-protein kinase 24/25/MST4
VTAFQGEIRVLSQCMSAHMTQYFGSFLDGCMLWIVMEYVPQALPAVLFFNNLNRYVAGGSLADVIASKTLDEQCIAVTLREVLKGLKYLHSQGKIHRCACVRVCVCGVWCVTCDV